MSRIKDFDDWFDAYGFQLEQEVEKWFEDCPTTLSDDRMTEIVNEVLEEAYETYVADYGDYIYEEMRDRQYED